MEKILVGINNENKITLIVYKNDPIRINPNNLKEEFDRIEQKYPEFKQVYYTPGTTKTITGKELEKYTSSAKKISKEDNSSLQALWKTSYHCYTDARFYDKKSYPHSC